ncbi:MAG: sigma-70 family RNA polymerase sigma factor [Candidatus Delongbacteria bacterium]|nr:sigma-70 family RNA polymerase sigma factor [Candidatus Delongbacteria bacterium]
MKTIAEENDRELIKKYVETKDQKYFARLMALYDGKLFNYIVRRIGHLESAKDVYQTVWLKIASNLDNYKEENKFSNYLFFIATNACFDYLRHLKKDNENIYREVVNEDGERRDMIDNLPSDTDDPEKENESREEKEMVANALNGLPDEQKDVILLRTKGLTFREIAEMKKVSVNSVLSRYRYAVDKIKNSIK